MPTTTLLFADQVGSTEQLRLLGDVRARAIRASLMRALEKCVHEHGGRVVDLTGDGLFAAFPGAGDALASATAMQFAVALANRAGATPADQGGASPVDQGGASPLSRAGAPTRDPAAAAQVAIRIGVHTGEPIVGDDGTLFGLAVVVARRLCDDADGGVVQVSDITRSLAESGATHAFTRVGPRTLKGIDPPIEAWSLQCPDPLATIRAATGASAATAAHGGPAGSSPAGGPPAGRPADGTGTGTGTGTGEHIPTPLATRTVMHPEAFVELADRWQRTVKERAAILVAVAGPPADTRDVLTELRRRIDLDGGLDLSDLLRPGPPPAAPLRTRVGAALSAHIPASARGLLVHPDPDDDPPVERLLQALGRVAPGALVVGPAAAAALGADDVSWLVEIGRTPGWFVAVSTDDEGRLASSPLAHLLADADAFVRVGSVPGSATEQHHRNDLATVFIAGRPPPAPGRSEVAEAPTILRPAPAGAATPRATVTLPDGGVVPITAAGVVIGRGREASLRIDDPDVSRRHIRILPTGGTWLLEDLGSTNGTAVNGGKVKEARLANGDEITIGATTLRFSLA